MAVIMSIAVVFDVSEKIDDFIKNKAPLKAILIDYYLNFVLYYGNLFSALLIFISVIFFTTKLANRTEFIAILSSGVSFKRLLLPYFVASTMLVGVSLILNHYLVPKATQERLNFERQYIGSGYTPDRRELHREIAPGTIAYFQLYSTSNQVGYKFSLEQWNDDGQLEYKLMAERAAFDSTSGQWQVHNYYERFFLPENQGEKIKTGTRLDTTLALTPDDLYFKVDFAAAYPYKALKETIATEKSRGSDTVTFYEIELYQRTSYPFATYVLTLIAVSIASRKIRGGLGLNLVFGFVMVFIYIFSMRLATVGATNAGLDPKLAVWIPNIIFGVMGIFIYRRAPK